MTKNKKVNFNKNETISIFLKYIPAFLKGFILMLLGILVLTFAYYKLQEKNDLLYFSCFFIIAISAFFTGSSTYKKLSGRGIVAGALALYFTRYHEDENDTEQLYRKNDLCYYE
jgi:hypothetical protein